MKTANEKALSRALKDACKEGLSMTDQRLIQTRIRALQELVRSERDGVVTRLMAELAAAKEEIVRLSGANPAVSINPVAKEIADTLAKYRAKKAGGSHGTRI